MAEICGRIDRDGARAIPLQAIKTKAVCWDRLGATAPCGHLARSIRNPGAARRRDGAVVNRHVAIEWIRRGIVYAGGEYILALMAKFDCASAPPGRRKDCSCSSVQICVLE